MAACNLFIASLLSGLTWSPTSNTPYASPSIASTATEFALVLADSIAAVNLGENSVVLRAIEIGDPIKTALEVVDPTE